MRSLNVILAGVLILSGSGLLWADIPILEPGVYLQNGSTDLQVQKYSTPTSADWNNDGAKDLIVAQQTDGNVWLLLNKGTDLNPLFNGGTKIESNGVPITFTST